MRRTLPLMIAVAGLAACGSDAEPTDTSTVIGLTNPASVFCVEQGGTVEIVDENGGQAGYCNLPDGTRVDEWEYYRAHNPTATTEP